MATLTIDVNSTTVHVLDSNDRTVIIAAYPSHYYPRKALDHALDLLDIQPEVIQAMPNTNALFTYQIQF